MKLHIYSNISGTILYILGGVEIYFHHLDEIWLWIIFGVLGLMWLFNTINFVRIYRFFLTDAETLEY